MKNDGFTAALERKMERLDVAAEQRKHAGT